MIGGGLLASQGERWQRDWRRAWSGCTLGVRSAVWGLLAADRSTRTADRPYLAPYGPPHPATRLVRPPPTVWGVRPARRGDDGRVQCHICGHFYEHLGAHSYHRHGLSADDYRAAFGLKQATKLIGDGYRQARRRAAIRQGLPQLARYSGNASASSPPPRLASRSRRARSASLFVPNPPRRR